jgi:hypothetical protein
MNMMKKSELSLQVLTKPDRLLDRHVVSPPGGRNGRIAEQFARAALDEIAG